MAETEFKYDVFVSYSSANKEWVRKTFVPILEKAGLKVCDYYRDFDVGAPIVMEMERAILESRKTIPILSPAYLKSGWTEFESLMFQTLDAANRNRRVLPVIFETCELPLRIKYMNCINFANPDDVDIEWERLSRALEVTLSPSLLETPKPNTGSRDTWHLAHPYPMPPNFTGRADELKMLDNWLADNTNRLFILRALGGFGKSTLAWQWINTHVDPAEWTKVIWWSFYEGDASFEHFIEETLKHLNLEVPQGQRPQVDELLKAMQGQKILLVMDGFERALRAYSSMNAAYQADESPLPEREDKGESALDCVNINAEIFLKSVCSLPNIKSKILMTTRLTPRAIKPHGEFMLGCREVELTSMQPADAVEFFHKQGINGTHAEIEAACAPYGYHPLSLRILAGLITNDREKPSDIVAAENFDVTEDLVQNQHHILEVAYNSLSTQERKLLSSISCLRSAINYQTIKAIHNIPSRQRKRTKINLTLDDSLRKLESIGLLQWERKTNKYDLHPIVRKYAYIRLNDTEKIKTHTRLRDYFAAFKPPAKIRSLDDLETLIEHYYHTVRAGELDKGGEFFYRRLSNSLYYQFSAYHLIIELAQLLNPDTEKIFNKLKNENVKAWMLSSLASSYSDSGQPLRGLPLLKKQIAIREKQGSQMNIGIGYENLAYSTQIPIGNLQDAEKSLQLSISAFQKAGDLFREATSHATLGQLFCYLAEWDRAKYEMNLASQSFQFYPQAQSELETFRVLLYLLTNRETSQSSLESPKSALQHAKLALELVKRQKDIGDPNERSFIRAHWLLGAVYRIEKQFKLAGHHLLEESLSRCRSTNLVASEADILLDLARLRYDEEKYNEAKSLADEALLITERSGYVLQGADVNLFLAQYALEQEQDKAKAKQYAEEAKKLATCDGPPYYYKVAYDEAVAMLERMKDEG